MAPPTTLTRQQFNAACQAYVAAAEQGLLEHAPVGWSWLEHDSYPGLGSLRRRITRGETRHQSRSLENDCDLLAEDDDPASSVSFMPTSIVFEQYVTFSPTYQVPCFSFNAYDSGTPLTLNDIAESSFLRHRSSLPSASLSPIQSLVAVSESSDDAAPFPLLTQSEHPTLGIPCWSIHPCETSSSMQEILAETIGDSWNETSPEHGLVRWLTLWFMLLGTIVDVVSL